MTLEKVKIIHAEMDKALKEIMLKYDLTTESSRTTYNDDGFSFSYKVLERSGVESKQNNAENNLKDCLACFGVNLPKYIGTRFVISGTTYEIIDYSTRAKKYPIIYRSVNTGTQYKCSPDYLAQYLK